MLRARIGALLIIAIAVATGCEKSPTQLVVLVSSDYDVPTELAFVTARVTEVDGPETSATEFSLTDEEDPADRTRFDLPLSFGVVPIDGDLGRRFRIEITGLGPARAPLLTRTAITGYVPEQSLLLPMFLARSCEDVVCGEEDQTCTEAGCVSEVIEPESLSQVTPGEELRDSGAGTDAMPTDTGVGSDAPSDTQPDTRPDATIDVSCDDTTCVCDNPYCRISCDAPSACAPRCTGIECKVDATRTRSLDASCGSSTTCAYDASMIESAVVECEDGAFCDVDCRDARSCDVRCRGRATCVLTCGGSRNCRISACGAATMSCPLGVEVCNTSCP